MNLQQVSDSVLDSNQKLTDLNTYYGINIEGKNDAIFIMNIIHNLIEESEWYGLSDSNIKLLYDTFNMIIRNNDLVYSLKNNNLYYNINNPQTSFTYDVLI